MKYIEEAGLWFPDADQHFLRVKGGRPFWKDYQADRLAAAYDHVQRWRTAVDVGAHVGLMARQLASRFREVVAFEPDPEAFACLQKNTAHLPNVRAVNAALGEADGLCELDREVGDNTGNRQIVPGAAGATPMRRLDDQALAHCDFLKIDVQGYEGAVLRGATETLMAFTPTILVEVEAEGKLRRTFEKPGRVAKMLSAAGASCRVQVGDDYIFSFGPDGYRPYTKYAERGDYHWQQCEGGKTADFVLPTCQIINRDLEKLEDPRVLDIGCGDGVFTAKIRGAIGLDNNRTAVALARRHQVEVLHASPFDLELPKLGRFDAVTMFDAFEHMPKQGLLLQRLQTVAPVLYVLNPLPNGSDWHTREFTDLQLVLFAESYGWYGKFRQTFRPGDHAQKTLHRFHRSDE